MDWLDLNRSVNETNPELAISRVRLFLSGLLMGVADLIPGISGGTVAYILGIYSTFIGSIAALASSWEAVFGNDTLARQKLIQFFTIIFGMALSIVLFSHLLHQALADPFFRPLLYSFFFGLTLASAFICLKPIRRALLEFLLISSSFLFAFMITGQSHSIEVGGLLSDHVVQPYVILGGTLAIVAMMLPGISGSYVLHLMGLYQTVLFAIIEISRGAFFSANFFSNFIFLLNLGCGTLVGALVFSRLIQSLLTHASSAMHAILVGFMLGSLKSVWPFWKGVSERELVWQAPSPFEFSTYLCLIAAISGSLLVIRLTNRARAHLRV